MAWARRVRRPRVDARVERSPIPRAGTGAEPDELSELVGRERRAALVWWTLNTTLLLAWLLLELLR